MKVGYLSQHADELGAGGPPGQSVLDATQQATGLTPNRARALLGRFLFSGDEVDKPLSGLSGGELRRLSLAVLVAPRADPPNVLILDEPTNHLDVESREALEDALRSFAGAILLVSHDRALLDAVGTRTVAIEGRALRSYVGGWPEYARVRDERRAAGEDPASAAPATDHFAGPERAPVVPPRAGGAAQGGTAAAPPVQALGTGTAARAPGAGGAARAAPPPRVPRRTV